jgi:hypothetical protein
MNGQPAAVCLSSRCAAFITLDDCRSQLKATASYDCTAACVDTRPVSKFQALLASFAAPLGHMLF